MHNDPLECTETESFRRYQDDTGQHRIASKSRPFCIGLQNNVIKFQVSWNKNCSQAEVESCLYNLHTIFRCLVLQCKIWNVSSRVVAFSTRTCAQHHPIWAGARDKSGSPAVHVSLIPVRHERDLSTMSAATRRVYTRCSSFFIMTF